MTKQAHNKNSTIYLTLKGTISTHMTNSKVEMPKELNRIICVNRNTEIHAPPNPVQVSVQHKYIAIRVSATVDPIHEIIINFRLPIRSTSKPIIKIPMTCIAAIIIDA